MQSQSITFCVLKVVSGLPRLWLAVTTPETQLPQLYTFEGGFRTAAPLARSDDS